MSAVAEDTTIGAATALRKANDFPDWLKRVPIIRGLDHLSELLRNFVAYYNDYRGHTTLGGAVPAVKYRGWRWDKPEKSAKTLPTNLERRVFPDTQITAYRLAA